MPFRKVIGGFTVPKFSGVSDKWCAIGFIVVKDSLRETYVEDGVRKCNKCLRPVRVKKDGTVMLHSWQPLSTKARQTRSETSMANRTARAFDERGRK